MPQRFTIGDPNSIYFVTSSTTYWIPIFTRDDYFRILADSLTYCVREKGLSVHAYVLMPNHFHMLCSHAGGELSAVMRGIKSVSSRQIAEALKEGHRDVWVRAMSNPRLQTRAGMKVWQDEFHPEEIRTQPFYEQKLNYIHNNPVRAGFVEDPAEWKYSSAGFYYKDRESIVPLEPVMW